jgi:hypothetical protein
VRLHERARVDSRFLSRLGAARVVCAKDANRGSVGVSHDFPHFRIDHQRRQWSARGLLDAGIAPVYFYNSPYRRRQQPGREWARQLSEFFQFSEESVDGGH